MSAFYIQAANIGTNQLTNCHIDKHFRSNRQICPHGTVIVKSFTESINLINSMSNENRSDDIFQNLKESISDFGKKVGNFMDDTFSGEMSGGELKPAVLEQSQSGS